jgi:integral membrane sensor domain MASE1
VIVDTATEAGHMRGLSITLAGAAAAIAIVGRTYHIVWHPEWTEPQALTELWMVWTLTVSCAIAAVAASAIGGQRSHLS